MNKELLFEKFPYLESDMLVLKKVESEDANDLFAILSDAEVFRYRPGNPWKTFDAVRNVVGHYERDFKKHKTIFLGIYYKKADDKLVGIAEIFEFDERVSRGEIGYTLNKSYWGMGIATTAVKMMLRFLFDDIDVNSVQATPMPVNVKSRNVLERCGFTHEGTLRQAKYWTGVGIVDLEMYSILKSEYVGE
ncbi:MAG: GNAT family N-acetyltransferase [Oscillospiraceae bacterium]|nr:GNAT family N-acetyltransferase [Oscillospiraceae bacterium]